MYALTRESRLVALQSTMRPRILFLLEEHIRLLSQLKMAVFLPALSVHLSISGSYIISSIPLAASGSCQNFKMSRWCEFLATQDWTTSVEEFL